MLGAVATKQGILLATINTLSKGVSRNILRVLDEPHLLINVLQVLYNELKRGQGQACQIFFLILLDTFLIVYICIYSC